MAEYSQYEGSKRRLAAVIRKESAAIHRQIEAEGLTHAECVKQLQAITAHLVQFTSDEIHRECGQDDLSLLRQAHDLADVRVELRHHQLVMEGIDLEEEEEGM